MSRSTVTTLVTALVLGASAALLSAAPASASALHVDGGVLQTWELTLPPVDSGSSG